MIGVGELDQPRTRFEVAVVPAVKNEARAGAFANKSREDVEGRAVGLRKRCEHELSGKKSKPVLGKDGIEGVAEWNELRFDAVQLRYTAKGGERVREQSLAQFLLRVSGRNKKSADESLMLLQHIERIPHWLTVFDDGGASERPGIHKFFDQVNRSAVIPKKLLPPLLRLFG